MLSELHVVLLFVILYNSTRSETIDQNPKLDNLTQHLYQEFRHLRLEKPANGTGLTLPLVLQKKFKRKDLRCYSFCDRIRCCICNANEEMENNDYLLIRKESGHKSKLCFIFHRLLGHILYTVLIIVCIVYLVIFVIIRPYLKYIYNTTKLRISIFYHV